jgi:peptidoglycan/LPS O-acetylase OafA/YrhL
MSTRTWLIAKSWNISQLPKGLVAVCISLRPFRNVEKTQTFRSVPEATRYGFIDAIRGIAACLVMLQHSLAESGLLGDWQGRLTGFIPNWLDLGETGVVAFFLVSGFVIPHSLERTSNFKLFWIHRALRIYPLYITVFIVTFAITGGGNIGSGSALFVDAIAHLFFVQEYFKQEVFVDGSWTLSLELVWYISISCLFLVSLHKKTNLLVGLSVLVSSLAQIACALGYHLPMGRLSMLLCCVFGLVCYRSERGEISRRKFATLFVILALTIAINLVIGFKLFPSVKPAATFREAIDSWTMAALIFFVPFFMRKAAIWAHSGFNSLGRISFSIYLMHMVVLDLVPLTPLNGVWMVCFVFAMTLCTSILTYRFIEAPPIRFGHSLKATTLR